MQISIVTSCLESLLMCYAYLVYSMCYVVQDQTSDVIKNLLCGYVSEVNIFAVCRIIGSDSHVLLITCYCVSSLLYVLCYPIGNPRFV